MCCCSCTISYTSTFVVLGRWRWHAFGSALRLLASMLQMGTLHASFMGPDPVGRAGMCSPWWCCVTAFVLPPLLYTSLAAAC